MHSKGAILFAGSGVNFAPTRSLRLVESQVRRPGSNAAGAGGKTDAGTATRRYPDAGGLA